MLASLRSADLAGEHILSGIGEGSRKENWDRRRFLALFSQGVGAALVPFRLSGLRFGKDICSPWPALSQPYSGFSEDYFIRPHYRSQRPLDAILEKMVTGSDNFVSEKYADEIATVLAEWTASLAKSSRVEKLANSFSDLFRGGSLRAASAKTVRADTVVKIERSEFSGSVILGRDAFLRDWQETLAIFSKIDLAEFQVTAIEVMPLAGERLKISTRVRYEIAGTGDSFHRGRRLGNWQIVWEPAESSLRITEWKAVDETLALTKAPMFADASEFAFAGCESYATQMLQGTDYWRTVIDGASGIDIYGHNGVSVADIDNDGFDDLYVCQPAGLPNRMYRNRGDGTFEDVTESSGLGVLENTACALFADFNNDGWQDVIVVRASGPALFLNQGGGKFREVPNAFQFANPPQGTFTGAAVADYDRDGWLDIYFCLYSYYQGTGQYRYPSPYHDAENGPPNFLMRNHRDGTFRDVTAASGLEKTNTRYSFCCAWNDFDGDGWPDLYVVNDFGRKNLYRNNGDGTFNDVAAAEGAEDVGAGMGVAWFDYDRNGADDLYVANMWTAAGVRVSTQPEFKRSSPAEVRALYQKHAMGNSLLRNREEKFEDTTMAAGVGIGRWAWSSDALDFDHDGFPDLYVANGMVAGPIRTELNSFFWRQVVANSPDVAGAAHDYELGWNAINELIRADYTWSGYERNVVYANNRDGTFSDVSGVSGLDFPEDGRSFVLADFNHDGRLEIALKNRNAPQLRLLKNVVSELPPSIVFRLKGTKSNRDAIGASVTIETSAGKQTRRVQAGSGFLSQHSKELFFGLGEANVVDRVIVRWPSGTIQRFEKLPGNRRVWIEEGVEQPEIEVFVQGKFRAVTPERGGLAESLPESVETWLLAPVPAPQFSLPDQASKTISLAAMRGRKVLLYLCTTKSDACRRNLESIDKSRHSWLAKGLEVVGMEAGDFVSTLRKTESDDVSSARPYSFPLVRASEDVAAVYNILYRQLFDRHRDLLLPTAFLVDSNGMIVKVYQGVLPVERVGRDVDEIPRDDAERLKLGLPFASPGHRLDFGRNHLSFAGLFFQRGYFDQAGAFFQQALRDDPESAEALYGIGSVYLNQNKNVQARETFERCIKRKATYPETLPDAWNNLGVLATRENRIQEAVADFQEALKISPTHLLALTNLGNAYRAQKRWGDAQKIFESALQVSPEDAEANYGIAMVFAQANQTERAHDHLQRALRARPDYPEALNNLGVLYIMTGRRDDAVASFEKCIRVAPEFDQAYVNLARVYAIEGAKARAREVLSQLLEQYPDHAQAQQMLEQLQ